MAIKHMKITVVFILQSVAVIVTLLKMTRCCCHGMRFFSSPRDLCTQRFWSDLIQIVLGFWDIIWSFPEISPITFHLWGFAQSRHFDTNRLKSVPKICRRKNFKVEQLVFLKSLMSKIFQTHDHNKSGCGLTSFTDSGLIYVDFSNWPRGELNHLCDLPII